MKTTQLSLLTELSQDMMKYGIDERIASCMPEMKEVLQRHGLDGRIGLQILHTHFEIKDDEVLFESIDEKNRTLLFQTVKRDSLSPEEVFVSGWDPCTGRALTKCPRTHQCHRILDDVEL